MDEHYFERHKQKLVQIRHLQNVPRRNLPENEVNVATFWLALCIRTFVSSSVVEHMFILE